MRKIAGKAHRSRFAFPAILLVGVVLSFLWSLGFASPVRPWDSFVPSCTFVSDPPPQGWKKWSDPSTWPTEFGGRVPGVGALSNANVTIPCGSAVLLDVPSIHIGLLLVQGLLRFLDSPSLPLIDVSANFIVVEGQLSIGSPSNHFSQRAMITLTPNPNQRADFLYSNMSPADKANPRNLGHKAFAVVGGQVHLHGMPGGPSTPSWVKLKANTVAGDVDFLVDGDVSSWPTDGDIAIASTDYEFKQTERLKIYTVNQTGRGWIISTYRPINFMRFGDPLGISDGFGGFVDERAEVVLLTRNIVIQGLDEPSPNNLDGGHFVVFFTRTPQFIEGVEFVGMGKQGEHGRYPLHFQFHGWNGPRGSVCRKNAIWNSKQRCLVIQGTSFMTIEENVAFNTSGHCFVLQDGSEIGNKIVGNVGLVTRRVTKPMPLTPDYWNWTVGPLFTSPRWEGDEFPATFYFSNPNNSFIGNVAGGSDGYGFSPNFQFRVRGLSALDPNLNFYSPFYSIYDKFEDNVMHSHSHFAMSLIPQGGQPRVGAFLNASKHWSNIQFFPPFRPLFKNLTVYKNQGAGILVDTGDGFIFDSCTFADNTWGLYIGQCLRVMAQNCRFVALTENYGNPQYCNKGSAMCAPVNGCSLPVAPGQPVRTTGYHPWPFPQFGVVIDQNNHTMTNYRDPAMGQHGIVNCTFYNYNSTCRVAAGIGVGFTATGEYVNGGNYVVGLRFNSSSRVYLPGSHFPGLGDGKPRPTLEFGQYMTMWDKDGSLVDDPKGGFAVANNPRLIPPRTPSQSASTATVPGCMFHPDWNGFSCTERCFRTVSVTYYEVGFKPLGNSPKGRQPGYFSYISINRIDDGSSTTLYGNLNTPFTDGYNPRTMRYFFMTLLAGSTYELVLHPPKSAFRAAIFDVRNISIGYRDDGGCGQPVTLRVRPFRNKMWAPAPSPLADISRCPGTPPNPNPDVTTYSYVCDPTSHRLTTQLLLGSNFAPDDLVVTPQLAWPSACVWPAGTKLCSVFSGGSNWTYDVSGRNLQPAYPGGPAFYTPLLNTSSWSPPSPGPLGYYLGWNAPFFGTFLPKFSTNLTVYYFRSSFSLTNSSCYSSLSLSVLLDDGVVVYLNGKQILMKNLPNGVAIRNTTLAVKNLEVVNSATPYTTYTLPLTSATPYFLVDGTNYLAAEVHPFATWAWTAAFDVKVLLQPVVGPCKKGYLHELPPSTDPTGPGSGSDPVSFVSAGGSSGISGPLLSPSVGGATSSPLSTGSGSTGGGVEICDGLDNNGDGLVDIDPKTGQLLTQPCSTACGNGTQTCMDGSYSLCSSQQPAPEICNGKDDNCDGMVDNGPDQLDCTEGSVCFNGRCLKAGVGALDPVLMFSRKASGWYYYDLGYDYPSNYPDWSAGNVRWVDWTPGAAPLGFNVHNASEKYGSVLNNIQGKFVTFYFLHNFTLTQQEAANTLTIFCSVRRDDGAIVYINGHELFQTNMPAGPIDYMTLAAGISQVLTNPAWNSKFYYYPCTTCSPDEVRPYIKPGLNWIAAELHAGYLWSDDATFDMDLYRSPLQPCTSITGTSSATECVRYDPDHPTEFLAVEGTVPWRYLDASMPVPSGDGWKKPGFDDRGWKQGLPAFGNGGWYRLPTMLQDKDDRITFYFRTVINVSNAPCYFNVTGKFLANDGGILYINGGEAFRWRLPDGEITEATPATTWGDWWYNPFNLSTGWLQNGPNTLAVELHKGPNPKNTFFDLGLWGVREAVNCNL